MMMRVVRPLKPLRWRFLRRLFPGVVCKALGPIMPGWRMKRRFLLIAGTTNDLTTAKPADGRVGFTLLVFDRKANRLIIDTGFDDYAVADAWERGLQITRDIEDGTIK